ncbi:MAG: hypothetical protein GYA21_02875 [Myxococcales bacterium]|nr:hypothetical protein [Myxococcales bacterium]
MTRNKRFVTFLALIAGTWAACGQSVDRGTQDGGATVMVQYGAESKSIALASIAPIIVEGNTGVQVSAVIAKAFPAAVLSSVGADFIAPDGFRPAAKSGCRPLIPIPGANLDKGVLDPQSANLLWAPSLGYGGCMGVKGVSQILMVNLADSGQTLQVRLDAAMVDVDLRFQQTTDVGEEQRINLQNLVKSSGITDTPQDFTFDLEAADGSHPSADHGGVLLTWEQLAHGTLHPQTRNLAFDAAAGLAAYWNLSEARALILHP